MIRKAAIAKTDANFDKFFEALISEEFTSNYAAVKGGLRSLRLFIDALVDNVWLYVETDYVDKVYRDSYYRYYASKANIYVRNCIKISFFQALSDPLPCELDSSKYDYYQKCYRGFLILRPTLPAIIGRNAISPLILKQRDFVACLANIQSTVDGLRFSLNAFPASSQDGETITCAETTMWSMMEYFGNKYPEYRPTLPSNILRILENVSFERQLPSEGLSYDMLSYLAKSYGFGPRIYHRDGFGEDSYNIFSCLIESGIPLIVALGNTAYVEEKEVSHESVMQIGHAVLCIGHENLSVKHIDSLRDKSKELDKTKTSLMDYDDIEKRFVFIDDNFPPYQLDRLDTPVARYSKLRDGGDWKHCEIEHFVVPFYKKIYIDAFVVKKLVKQLVESSYLVDFHGTKITMRTFLCSTRSYRDYVKRSGMTDEMKREISSIFLPKFIWVTEFSSLEKLKDNKAVALLIIDATEVKIEDYAPVLLGLHNNKALARAAKGLGEKPIHTSDFSMYFNNLKES